MRSGHIYHNFSCCDDLSKYGKEYLNSLKCEFCTFFSIKFRKFWHTARLSRTNRHKVIKSENSPVFWPTLYIYRPTHPFRVSYRRRSCFFQLCEIWSPRFRVLPFPLPVFHAFSIPGVSASHNWSLAKRRGAATWWCAVVIDQTAREYSGVSKPTINQSDRRTTDSSSVTKHRYQNTGSPPARNAFRD